nr:hypothetical protein [Tanacetum cinerariifolium]
MFKKKNANDEAKRIEKEEVDAKAIGDEDAKDNEDNAEKDTEKDANESVDAAVKAKKDKEAAAKRSNFIVRLKARSKELSEFEKQIHVEETKDDDVNEEETENKEDAKENDDVVQVFSNIQTIPTRNIEKEEDMESNEDGGSNNENEMLSVAKKKKRETMKRKTKYFDSKKKKLRNNASEDEDDTESKSEEELKLTRKMNKDRAEEDTKPIKKMTYPACNIRSSPKALFDAMSCLTNERKRCLKQMGFERYINFLIVELTSTLAYHEAQYSHLKKPTPQEIVLQISSTTKEDFMFKMNFLTLFGSTMGTLENGVRVPTKLLKYIKEEDDTAKIDWCGYILDCLRNSKVNWKDVKTKNNFYYGPLTSIMNKIIQKFDKISEERSELVRTLRDRVKKFENDQMMIEFCKQYEELFNDDEFNVNESSMNDYKDDDSDADDDNKKNNDKKATMADGNKKNNEDENNKDNDGSEAKDDGYEVKDDVNNENNFENLFGDDREDEVSMDIDIPNEEMKQKEADKEKVSKKNGNESKKKKQYEADKVEKVQEIQEEHNCLTQDHFWDKEYHLTNKQYEELEIQATKDIKKKQTTKRKSIVDMTPPLFSLGLSPTENELKSKNKEERVEKEENVEKDDFVFETKDGAATIRDYMQTLAPQLKVESNVIDNFSLILNHEQKMNSKGKKSKKIIFHASWKVKHPRAKDVLMKKPTILRPKWGTKENDTYCEIFFDDAYEALQWRDCKELKPQIFDIRRRNTLDIIKMRVRLATKILSHEINIHREKISTEAQEFARRNTDKNLRKQMIKEAIKTKKEKQESERV